ncbi:MAG: glycosyltransferase [Terracidiphilus sp.]|jgi:GT2 family glycosyltransferase
MAKISVLMNVFNVEVYIAEALASIQSQTFTDIEIVVADDGSTDGTRATAEAIASTDSRIRVVGTARNQGVPYALNFGLQFCCAPFIAKMDGDDIALPTRLEKQLAFLEKNQDIALVGCATSAIDELRRPIPGLGVSMKPMTQEAIAKTALLAPPCSQVWLARREVYDTLSGYREMLFAEDYDFLLRAIAAGFRITNLPESLMLIRTRSGNMSSRLEQRKAHYYIANLYRERIRNGQDSFSRKGYELAVNSGRLEDGAFRLAMKCVRKGLLSHSRVMRYLLLAISVLVSPWQARYFLLRLRLKMSLRTPGFQS